MYVPIRFPDDVEVIAAEAARFRALSHQDRMNSIRGLLAAGALMMRRSPNAEFLRTYSRQQEELARQAVKEFVTRHGGRT